MVQISYEFMECKVYLVLVLFHLPLFFFHVLDNVATPHDTSQFPESAGKKIKKIRIWSMQNNSNGTQESSPIPIPTFPLPTCPLAHSPIHHFQICPLPPYKKQCKTFHYIIYSIELKKVDRQYPSCLLFWKPKKNEKNLLNDIKIHLIKKQLEKRKAFCKKINFNINPQIRIFTHPNIIN